VAGGTASGTLASDNRSLNTIASDNKIEYLAGQRLVTDPELSKQAHVVVVSYNHVVLLAGQAPTQELRSKAVQVVQGVPNMRRIFNEITLDKPTSAMARSKDVVITGNVKTRMLATTNLHSGRFKIVTENGTVFLMGLSTRKQANIAVAVIRNSTGVKRVVRLVEYVSPEGNDAAS
jgi:osmotically-inducible protein OsmY